jgi:hypothetical protein
MRIAIRLLVLALFLAWPSAGRAYPFMIQHGYTGCGECHVDPSGGGALTEYGRGQAEILLRTPWGIRPEDWEPPRTKDFAFGVVSLPEWLALQGDGRVLVVPEPSNTRVVAMQSDLRAAVHTDRFVAYGSAGWVDEGATEAWVSANDGTGGNLVSREYWVGWKPDRDLLVRGGRMALPFGIRSEEHKLFVRSTTETDTNADQQLGADAVWSGGAVRAEVMGILGNIQVSPDDFRERGYSAVGSYALRKNLEVGASSLLAYAVLDTATITEQIRQAHGLFGRFSPVQRLALFGEADVLLDGTLGPRVGAAGYLQLDVEALSGFHVKGTGEWCDDDFTDTSGSTARGTATLLWFFAPHADVRADAMYGTLDCTPGVDPSFMGLLQAHVFL